ncbi:hypothetical protein J4714_12730 [Staphylococcus epidermidis]|nr:hypothetical protein [Staphylococcus epidermidis]
MAETVYQARRRFYLLRFRRSRNGHTGKMYESMRDRGQVPPEDTEAFEAAADHRRAELASGRIWDKIRRMSGSM